MGVMNGCCGLTDAMRGFDLAEQNVHGQSNHVQVIVCMCQCCRVRVSMIHHLFYQIQLVELQDQQ